MDPDFSQKPLSNQAAVDHYFTKKNKDDKLVLIKIKNEDGTSRKQLEIKNISLLNRIGSALGLGFFFKYNANLKDVIKFCKKNKITHEGFEGEVKSYNASFLRKYLGIKKIDRTYSSKFSLPTKAPSFTATPAGTSGVEVPGLPNPSEKAPPEGVLQKTQSDVVPDYHLLSRSLPKHFVFTDKDWLNDMVVFTYSLILVAKSNQDVFIPKGFTNYDYKPENIARYVCDYLIPQAKEQNKDLQNVKIPFFVNPARNHWTLVFIDSHKRTIEYYDSFVKYGEQEIIQEQLNIIRETLSTPDRPYSVEYKITNKVQQNGYDCGVWACYFLDVRLEDPTVDFNKLTPDKAKETISAYRKNIRQEIESFWEQRGKVLEQEYQDFKNNLDILKKARAALSPVEHYKRILNETPLRPESSIFPTS